MNESLTMYREQLRGAIDADLRGRQTRTRRRLALGVPALAASATAAALMITTGSPSGTSPADAAILHGVSSALAPPAGTIIHVRALVSLDGRPAVPYELWAQSDSPHAYRVIKFGHEFATSHGRQAADDFAGTLHELVGAGKATVDETTTFDGVRAYKLTVAGSPERFLNGTAYVAASDYRPLELDTTANGGERIHFSAYEYLPATAANMRLINR